jgi:tetratricopeptide (TPR) repeat protein
VILAVLALWLAAPATAPGDDCRRARKLGRPEAQACFTTLAKSERLWPRAEGLWGLRQYDDANVAFRLALKASPNDPLLRVRWGRLLLERFNAADATGLFNEALDLQKDYAPALLGLARTLAEGFDRRALELAKKVLEQDPKLIEARELYAQLLLEDGDFPAAGKEALQALGDDPKALDAMAHLATIDLLRDKPTSEWTGRMLAVNPHYGEGFARMARHFVLNRRYEEGIAHYRRAVELDPDFLPAQSELGINLMRAGEDVEARKVLEGAHERGFKDRPTTNSLRLLDSYKNFLVYKQPRFILRLHKSEAALLRPYVEREMMRALDTFDAKYGFKLPGAVTVEMYPDHEDFAVRTMGMPGLGALGVTFGLSIAMDSPSGRRPGTFHWASTLWHELSHAYVLTATRHRTPRWFTEGLSVHEETAVSPEWGDRLTPDVIGAIKQKKLLPIATLDRGFIRPSYPGQVIVSYFQAGRICDYINQRWGWPKLRAMMSAYSRVTTTAEVVETVLGRKPEEFDTEFLAWLDTQHKTSVERFEAWSKAMKPLNEARKAKRWDEVLRDGPKLRDDYVEYVEAGSVYEALADAYEATGDKAAAMAELSRYLRTGGRDPLLIKRLAALQEESGNRQPAEATLRRLLWIYPVKDEELHRKLGTLRATLGDWHGSAEEWRAVIAIQTPDPASANYELARAYKELQQFDNAKDALLSALETAPGYRPAQRLLLELNQKEQQKQ